jgi:hypothetical protein
VKERAHLGCLTVGEKITLKEDVKEIGWESVDCTYMAWDMDKRGAVDNKVMNIRLQ